MNRMELSQEQKQILSQNQLQSLEILSMDQAELRDFMQEEYLENPLLDYVGNQDPGVGKDEIQDHYEQMPLFHNNYEDMMEDEDKRHKDIPSEPGNELREFLLEQIDNTEYSEKEWNAIEYMVDCLDDNGFFTVPLTEISEKLFISEECVFGLLKKLKSLEPIGIFSENLRECLLTQLHNLGQEDSAAYQIVEHYLEEAAAGRYSSISRGLKISTAEVRSAIASIVKLNPRPSSEFAQGKNSYVIPDILLREEDGKWEISLNDGWIEDYQINDYYLRMLKESKDPELKEYFTKRLERVRFIQSSIRQRRETMKNISEELFLFQEDYLLGKGELRPLTMNDLAKKLNIHASTVSRAVKGKYLECPRGIVQLKKLFCSGARSVSGEEDLTAGDIKNRIQDYVLRENKQKPYSDQALTELLRKDGIEISRRAVAKYREALGIKGSFARRE